MSAGGKNLPAGNKKWPVKTTSTREEEEEEDVQPGSEDGAAVKDKLILVACCDMVLSPGERNRASSRLRSVSVRNMVLS